MQEPSREVLGDVLRENGPVQKSLSRTDGIIVTGQSLAEGGIGQGVGAVMVPAAHGRAFMVGPRPVGLAQVPLSDRVELLREYGRVSVAHTLTDSLVRARSRADHDYRVFLTGRAWGGKPYRDLRRGADLGLFEMTMNQARIIRGVAPDIVYKAVVCIHGEQDGLDANGDYASALAEWQSDFSAALSELTGQTSDVPLFICQTASGSGYGFSRGILEDAFPTPICQLAAHESNSRIRMVCSKYHLAYRDHAHLTPEATSILGEYYAKALLAYEEHGEWSPLRPLSAKVEGATIEITFCGNKGDLVLDCERVKQAANFGFEYHDGRGTSIESVSVAGSDRILLRLNGAADAQAILAYAYHNGAGGGARQVEGLGDRGNLRDSDPVVSVRDKTRLYNWCVIFRKQLGDLVAGVVTKDLN